MSAGIYSAEHVHVPFAGHMLPQQAPHVINDAIRQTMAQHQRHEPMSARRLGMRALAYPRALPPKKPNNCAQQSLNDQPRLVAGSMTNHA
jgi:hypothetical protein